MLQVYEFLFVNPYPLCSSHRDWKIQWDCVLYIHAGKVSNKEVSVLLPSCYD